MKNLALVALAAVLAASAAWAATTINAANAPMGAHIANGSLEPGCTVDSSLDVTCNAITIGGVGNASATAVLSVTYSGTVQCTNHGGNVVDVKTQTTPASSAPSLTADRNGQLPVPQLGVTAPTTAQLLAEARCPNGNWTKQLIAGPTLVNFVYTLTFVGFTGPYIDIVGP